VGFSDFLAVFSAIVGIVALWYAVYQGSERRKLREFIRGQNWHLYAKANNANGTTQVALTRYKQKHAAGIDGEVVELLAKADAFGQDVFKDVIRQIQVAEPAFDHETIARWVAGGRVAEAHAIHFKNLAPLNKNLP
jgi:hypothetical protein